MSFKHSCFIENSKEAREWLEGLGYRVDYTSNNRFLRTYTDGIARVFYFLNWIYEDVQPIDCRSNLPLFKALTAVRDDSCYKQWYILEKCHPAVTLLLGDWFISDYPHFMHSEYARKATKDELIEKFKNKDE